jgi:hypothetical protein
MQLWLRCRYHNLHVDQMFTPHLILDHTVTETSGLVRNSAFMEYLYRRVGRWWCAGAFRPSSRCGFSCRGPFFWSKLFVNVSLISRSPNGCILRAPSLLESSISAAVSAAVPFYLLHISMYWLSLHTAVYVKHNVVDRIVAANRTSR